MLRACADPVLCVAPNVCSPSPLASALDLDLDLDSPLAGQCTWLWLDIIQKYVCVAGTAQLAMDRSTPSPTRFAFSMPPKSTATYCFSFAYLAGQTVRVSLQFDQPVYAAVNVASMASPQDFGNCISPVTRFQPGSFDPSDVSFPCSGFAGWYTPDYSLVTIAGTGSAKATNVWFSLDGAVPCMLRLLSMTCSLDGLHSDVLAVIGDACKYDWEYYAYSECSKKCVRSRSTSGCRCSAGAVLPPYDEARCPTPLLNSTCFDGLCDGTRLRKTPAVFESCASSPELLIAALSVCLARGDMFWPRSLRRGAARRDAMLLQCAVPWYRALASLLYSLLSASRLLMRLMLARPLAGNHCELGTLWLSQNAFIGYGAGGLLLVVVACACVRRSRSRKSSASADHDEGGGGLFVHLVEQGRLNA
jgi:hypothetical protein